MCQGRHFSDAAARRMLEVLGEMYELQIDLDAVNGAHIPIDFGGGSRMRLWVCTDDATDVSRGLRRTRERSRRRFQALRATTASTALTEQEMNCMIDLNKPCISGTEIVDIAIDFVLRWTLPMSECRRVIFCASTR